MFDFTTPYGRWWLSQYRLGRMDICFHGDTLWVQWR